MDELIADVRDMKKEQSLGPNGLPVEFYKMWHEVGPAYLKICQEAI